MSEFLDLLYRWWSLSTHRSINDFVQFVKISGLSMPQITVLMHLYYRGPAEVSHIKNYIAGSNAAASQIVERLLQQGLVERSNVQGDRRVRLVSLTEHGRQLIQDGIAARQYWMDILANELSPEEQAAASHVLQMLVEKIGRVNQPPEKAAHPEPANPCQPEVSG